MTKVPQKAIQCDSEAFRTNQPIQLHTLEKILTICAACKTEFDEKDNISFDGDWPQYDEALLLGLFGGYGMFVESGAYVSHDTEPQKVKYLNKSGATYEAVLCHDCAHKLCAENPWLEEIIDTYHAHSHNYKYLESHPDHYGWDYDNDNTYEENQWIKLARLAKTLETMTVSQCKKLEKMPQLQTLAQGFVNFAKKLG